MAYIEQFAERNRYRVVLVLPWAKTILAELDGEALRLPHISIPKWTRTAEEITDAIRELWNLVSIVIDYLPAESNLDPCAVLEVSLPDWQSVPSGLTPVAPQKLPPQELSPSEFSFLRDILAGDIRNQGPFSRIGWIEEAQTWIRESVHHRVIEFSDDIRQANAGKSFALVRFGTRSAPAYWLKAVGFPNLHEFTVTATLARYFPDHVPPLIATREDWNAWIMEDCGQPLSETFCLDAFEQAAHSLAQLQMASTAHLDLMLSKGVFDQRKHIFRAYLPQLVQYLESVMAMQTSTAVLPIRPERLQEIGGLLEKACAAMQTANVPDTLIHNDMNGGNILFDGTRAVFTDWAEASIGNPFFTFHHLRALAIREDHTHTWAHQLTAAYKRHWHGLLAESDLDRALALTRPLAIVSYLYGRDPSFASEYRHDAHCQSYARSLARHLDRAIQAPEFMGALCD
jgi:hypothetical protein